MKKHLSHAGTQGSICTCMLLYSIVAMAGPLRYNEQYIVHCIFIFSLAGFTVTVLCTIIIFTCLQLCPSNPFTTVHKFPFSNVGLHVCLFLSRLLKLCIWTQPDRVCCLRTLPGLS